MSESEARQGDTCWAFGHETEDEPVCIHCGQSIVGP